MKLQTVLFRPLWPHQCSTDMFIYWCIYERERERERDRQTDRQTEKMAGERKERFNWQKRFHSEKNRKPNNTTFSFQKEELQQLESNQASAKMKFGPCEAAVEPVLQANNIQRQKYFGWAFIGNHIHHALQRKATHAISHCHVEVISQRCPDLL